LISRFLLVFILLGLVVLNFSHQIYFNIFTHSLPYGIYSRVNGFPQKGDFAATCLPSEIAHYGIKRNYLEQGHCDSGSVLVLKVIKGIPGDHYLVKDQILELNKHFYPIMSKDSVGRPLKVFYDFNKGVINQGQYFLLSDFVKNSWDSRYWGPVHIQFLLKPLFLFESTKT